MLDSAPAMNADEIEQWLVERIARELGVPEDEIDTRRPFASYNVDSLLAAELSGELETKLELSFAPTLLFEQPTIERLARHLARLTRSR